MDLLGKLAVCNDEVQEMRREKSIFEYLKSERKAVVRAMNNNDHEFPTLLKRLIHISSVQLGNLSRLNRTHINTMMEVIKVVQQYLGEVENQGSKEVTAKQHQLVQVGTLELLVRLMSWADLPRKLLLKILDLCCSILAVAGGYEEAQRRIYQFLCDSASSQSFFLVMENQFKLSSEKLPMLHSAQCDSNNCTADVGLETLYIESKHSQSKTALENTSKFAVTASEGLSVQEHGVADDLGNCKLFLFWQWLCEGNYQPNQHLLRAQPHNPRSINLLALSVTFLSDIAERDLGQVEYLRVAISVYNVLCKSVQGACLDNQKCLAFDTELLETSDHILQQINGWFCYLVLALR